MILALAGVFLALAAQDKVDFNKDVYPILKAHCIPCHTHNVAKAELRLDTVELMLKGGENGPAVVRGDSAKSLLYQALIGQGDVFMPPKKNKVGVVPLKPEQIATLKRWIDQGAAPSAVPLVLNTEPIPWQPLPPGLNPINAVSVSPDGLYAACGRANQVFVYAIASGAPPARLLDPALAAGQAKAGPSAADRDLILSLAFSPDGLRLASGGYRCIRLWRRAEAAPALALDGATIAAASPDEKWIATAAADFTISVWDASSGKRVKELKGHTAAVRGLAFSPDAAALVSGSADKSVRVWILADGQSTQAETPAEVNAVAWISGGKGVASGGADSILRLHALPFEKTKELKAHKGPVTSLSAAKGGQRLLSGSEDGTLRLWDADAGKELRKMEHGAPVMSVAAAPDAKRWASAGGAFVKVWKENGEALATLKGDRVLADALGDAERSVAFAKEQIAYYKSTLQESEKALATETESAKKAADRVKSASTEATQKQEAAKKAEAARAALAPQAAEAETARKQSADAAAEAEKKAPKSDESKAVAKAHAALLESQKAFDEKLKAADKALADARQAAQQADQAKSAAEQNDERLVQVQKKGEELVATTKQRLAASDTGLKAAEAALATAQKAAADAEKPLRSVTFSGDGLLIAAAGEDRILHTWHVESGRPGEQYRGLEAPAASISFLGGRKLLAVVGAKALVWDGHSRWTLERKIGNGEIDSPLMDRVLALTWSPDGKTLVSGGGIPARTGELKVWNPETGVLIREFKDAHSDTVFGLAFTRDGSMLASGAADKLIRIWDPASGKQLKLFEGHTQHVLSVGWRRHGRTLVSSGADKVAKVWDLVTGEQLKSIEGFRKEVTSTGYLEAQNNEILLASGDGQLRSSKEDGGKVRGYQFGKEYIESAVATPDGRLIVAGGSDSVLRVFESSKDKILFSFDPP